MKKSIYHFFLPILIFALVIVLFGSDKAYAETITKTNGSVTLTITDGEVSVTSYDELAYAVTLDEVSTVTIADNITITDTIEINRSTSLLINGSNTLSGGGSAFSPTDTETCFLITGSSTNVNLDDITVKNFVDTAIVVSDGAGVTVSGGTYSSNMGQFGGAFRVKDGAKLTVLAGTFEDNKAEDGGAIFSGNWSTFAASDKGTATLQIYGGTFKDNESGLCYEDVEGYGFTGDDLSSRSHGYRILNVASKGGGAIWSDGSLTVAGGTFSGNTAKRGCGGAIFINKGKDNFISAGTFTNNLAWRLGGAIYTEETTYTSFGEASVHDNNAGHFGGGLWLCPSGQSTFSETGFAAIFDNDADLSHDRLYSKMTSEEIGQNRFGVNRYSILSDDDYDCNASGDDISVMYPNKGGSANSSYITLATQWFTGESVYWFEDRRPTEQANGYTYLYPYSAYSNYGFQVDSAVSAFTEGTTTTYTGAVYPGTLGYGIGVVSRSDSDGSAISSAAKANANSAASLLIYDNTAYWSGGGIGTDGSVNFEQYGILSWTKKDSETLSAIAGSTWMLAKPDGTSVYITDNEGESEYAGLDTSTKAGVFVIEHLPVGTYTLVEVEAPDNYIRLSTTYTATITEDKTIATPKEIVYVGDDGSIYNDKIKNPPDEPDQPDEPDNPDNPPDEPGKPDEPDSPDSPDTPDEPTTVTPPPKNPESPGDSIFEPINGDAKYAKRDRNTADLLQDDIDMRIATMLAVILLLFLTFRLCCHTIDLWHLDSFTKK